MEQAKNKKSKIPKEISQEILKRMFKSLLQAVGITLYFIILNVAYSNINQERLIKDIEVFAGVFLIIGIIFIEKAYKKDSGSLTINGIEFLVLSLHSLSIMHIITLLKYDFKFYLLTSSYVFSIYYVLKAIVLYTKGRKNYLNSLSDINEIIKKDEPIKREAQRRVEDVENIEVKENIEKVEKKSNRRRITKQSEDKKDPKDKNEITKKRNTKSDSTEKTANTNKEKSKEKSKTNTAKSKRTTKANETKTNSKTRTKSTAKQNTTKKSVTKSKSLEEDRKEEKPIEKRKRGRPRKQAKIEE